jgi:hypothetical protein
MTPYCSLLASISLILIACAVSSQALDPTRMPSQKVESSAVDEIQPLSRFSGQQLLELLLEKYRRAMAEDAVYEPVYDDVDLVSIELIDN